ncbi:unnamed protein product [Commensalibacter communis]|uniref:hypothetical protein n=1 Tax=Commensalibacter communis TaxID=2972786 RepID=UPI0022FF6F83|nr:hypothetical protein [Commensalibacter communis]CAI3937865.1 unnamed protein product [Commensalibacter communis]CAI3939091.1 unnamed protein product [Commensalibacter communis]
MATLGVLPVFVASLIIGLLHTREDRTRNHSSTYWFIWLIPAGILIFTNYTAYRYYINYTTQRDQKIPTRTRTRC